jgi:ferric-dicitrate binding protein FerR (iron transport regulator)
VDELIIRSLQHRTTESEERALRAWRDTSDQNERYYGQIASLWSLTQQADLGAAPRPAPAVADLLRRAPHRPVGEPSVLVSSRWRWPVWALGAAAVVVLGVGLPRLVMHEAGEYWLTPAEVVTGMAETATVVLSDHSVVRLAPSSKLRAIGERNERVVWFEGRAYFAVATDSVHPFVIRTPAGDARVVGTQFELESRGDSLRLVVVEGRVTVGAGRERVEVGAGEVSEVVRRGRPAVVLAMGGDELMMEGWLSRFMVFEATPLPQVVRRLEQRYQLPVRLVEDELTEQTVTAWFLDQSFAEAVTVVCRVVGARCSVGQSGATIGGSNE